MITKYYQKFIRKIYVLCPKCHNVHYISDEFNSSEICLSCGYKLIFSDKMQLKRKKSDIHIKRMNELC